MQLADFGPMRFTSQGEWKAQAYTMNSAVRLGNSVYVSNRNVIPTDIPGKSDGWDLWLHGEVATTNIMGMGYVAREGEITSGKVDADRENAPAFVGAVEYAKDRDKVSRSWFPDYGKSVARSIPTQKTPFTMPYDGWISPQFNSVGSKVADMYIDEQRVSLFLNNSESGTVVERTILPVEKGSKCYTTGECTAFITYPCKGVS